MSAVKQITQWDQDTGDTILVNANGWTTQEGTLTRYPKYGTMAQIPIKRRYLEVANSVAGRAKLSYDASSADANRADYEICTVIVPSLLTAGQFEVAGRVTAGVFGGGYVVEGNPAAHTMALAKYVTGTRTPIGIPIPKTFARNAAYLNCVGVAGAVELDNGETITRASAASLNFGTGSFTVEGWFYHRDYTNPRTTFPISKQGITWNTTVGWGIGAGYAATALYIFVHDGTTFVGGNVTLDVGYRAADIQNKWAHIACVFDRIAKKVFIYINGVLQSNSLDISAINTALSFDNANNLWIGNAVGWGLDGWVDEFRVWTGARTLAQILAYKDVQAIGNEANLVMRWSCNEASGTNVADSTINALDGTASGTSTRIAGFNSGNGAVTADSVKNSVLSDIDIRMGITALDYTPAANQMLISHATSAGNNFGYEVYIQTTGNLVLRTSPDGTVGSMVSAVSSAATALTDNTFKYIRITRSKATGTVTFYLSSDYNPDTYAGTWTPLGTTIATTAGGIFDAATPLAIGVQSDGTALPFIGKIHRAQVFDGINGTKVVDFNPADTYPRNPSFSSLTTYEQWNIKGIAYLDSDTYSGAFFLRLRNYGKYLKVKLWEVLTKEPTGWDIVKVDASVTAAGLHTLGHYDAASTKKSAYNLFSLATLTPNILTFAEEFASWTNTTAPVTENAVVAPDGSVTAALISNVGGSGSCRTNSFVATATAHVYSVHVKQGVGAVGSILMYNNTTASVLASVNLTWATGQLSISVGAGFVVALPDGWFRVCIYANAGITIGNTLITYVYAGSTGSAAGDSVYAWGARVDAGIVPEDYAPVAERPITDAEFEAWRISEAQRCFLVEFTAAGYNPAASPFTRTANAYLSTLGYTSKAWDTPANRHYEEIVEAIPSFTRSMGKDLRGPTSLSFGDLIFRNPKTSGLIPARQTMGLKFDGTQQAITTGNVAIPAQYTVEFWLRLGVWNGAATDLINSNFVASNYGAGNISIQAPGALYLWNGGVTGSGVVYAQQIIGSGGFYHVVGTFDGSTLRLYINGVQVASGTGTYSPSTAAPLKISGNESGSYKAPTGTTIDEVRVWNYARSQADIQYMMNKRAKGTEPGIVGCWHLDEGTLLAFNDSGPNAFHGTIPNANMWSLTGMPTDGLIGGDFDDLTRIRINREPLTILWGSKDWARHNFRTYIRGRIDQALAPSPDRIKCVITDMSTVFQKPLTGLLSNGPYYPRTIGIIAGMVEPPCIDDANQVYQLNNGPVIGNGVFGTSTDAQVYDNLVLLQTVGKFIAAGGITAGNVVPIASHGILTGFRFSFDNDGTHGVPTGGAFATLYYARQVDANNITVHPTRADALANTNIVALTTGTGALCTCRGYGYEVNESAGTLTIYAARVGRITISNYWDNNNMATGYVGNSQFSPYSNIDGLVFGAGGLSLSRNYQDLNNFLEVEALFGGTNHIMSHGVFMNGQLHTYEEMLNEIYATTNFFGGFTQDGLMQVGVVGPPGTPIVYLTEDDIEANSLKLIGGIRSIDFTKISMICRKNYVNNAAFPNNTVNINMGGFDISGGSYGSSSIPLDNFPNNNDSDTTAKFAFSYRLFTSVNGARHMIDAYLRPLYQKRIGLFTFKTTWAALHGDVSIGKTISLTHSRLGFKQWGPTDPSSGDAATTVLDGRLCVIKSITVDASGGGAYPITMEVYRHIHGYFPMGDII